MFTKLFLVLRIFFILLADFFELVTLKLTLCFKVFFFFVLFVSVFYVIYFKVEFPARYAGGL